MSDTISPNELLMTREYLEKRILELRQLVDKLSFNPELKLGEKWWELVNLEKEALGRLIKAQSSSNPGYEERDLSETARMNLKSIKHGVKILGALYGPKEKL